ncbi:Nitrate reductase (NADH) [Hordeum vulgare]|nr:Nitrate reductase (NADH) [Hordeum vulgare]
MDDHGNGGDDAERHRRLASDAARKWGSRRWLNYGRRPSSTFERRELEECERELAVRRLDSSAAGSSSTDASSSQTITPVKRRSEELGPLAVKLEDDAIPSRGGVIGPEDYLPPGQEDDLMRAIMERSVREAEEAAARNRREFEIEQIFFDQGVTTSHASASNEADLRVMKTEQDKIWIDLNSDEDLAPPSPSPRRCRRTRHFW